MTTSRYGMAFLKESNVVFIMIVRKRSRAAWNGFYLGVMLSGEIQKGHINIVKITLRREQMEHDRSRL